MEKFKGTKGEWEIREHSWSDTSIVSGQETIASISIYDEATEDNQEELGEIMEANAKLIATAPELLEALQKILDYDLEEMYPGFEKDTGIKKAINKALGL